MAAPILTISHFVFLTREQRYALQVKETEIEVVGSSSPVWIHEGRHITRLAEEVFAKYTFRHCPEPEENTITIAPGGFMVKLSPHMPIHLTDVADGGSLSLIITHKNVMEYQDKMLPIVHFLNVEDMEVLESTLC
jgi:hypothetical protein